MENEVNSDLHIAAALNHATVMRDMLATNCQLVERMDEHGDQPAHIAARLGNIEALRVLVEFDAPMSTRNYNFLTPLGEARMNERHDVIRLLNDNYIFRPNDGISRYVFRRIYPSTIPCQTVARAAARKLR
jgi:ankyrin repeat protein